MLLIWYTLTATKFNARHSEGYDRVQADTRRDVLHRQDIKRTLGKPNRAFLGTSVATRPILLALGNTFRTYEWTKQFEPIAYNFHYIQQILYSQPANYL